MAEVRIKGLTKRYGSVTAVDNLDLVIGEGEFVTLLGPSGCGKTTTLRCIAGLEIPDGGEIRIGDDPVVSAEEGVFVPPDRRDTGMVFQNYALWPHMTVFGNVAYPLRMQRRKRAEIKRQVLTVLRLVGLDHLADQNATRLSGGQQQRVSLARAVVSEPNLLLFDEPLSNLDAKLRAAMRTELRSMHARLGTTSIYVTHDQVEAMALSDRVVVMRNGYVQQIGTPRQIYGTPRNRFVADFVGFENFMPAEVTQTQRNRVLTQPLDGARPLWCPSHNGIATNALVQLAVRSSCIELSRSRPDQAENILTAVVQTRTYLGEQLEYTLDAEGTILKARIPDPDLAPGDVSTAPHVGDQLFVNLPAETIAILPSSDP